MITVHDRTATTFTTTGLGVLDREIINPIVTEELGGEFSLTFTYPADGPAAQHLVLENIVAAPVPGLEQRQGFRISEVVTTIEGLLEVTAFHVFYDLAANLIADTYVVNKTAKGALTQILGAANTKHGFTATSSDTVTRSSARLVRMPIAQALMDAGEDNTFAARWGGELVRDNFHIHHALMRGANHGVVIRDRKNLTGFESAIDFSTVVTRILPVGYDGLLLPELYVDSPKLGDYVVPRIRVIRYGQVKAITDKDNPREGELPLDQAHAQLRRLAAAEFSAKHVDEPSASYKIRFTDLSQTREYADLARLETVEIGDTVTVRHTDLGIALTARVVAYEYNPLTLQYISVELGTVARKFTSVTRQVKTAINTAVAASDAAGFALASADGKNTNHYGRIQPANARLGDTWFRQNGETTEIWIYRLTDTGQPGWVALATDLNHAQVQAELDAARAEVDQALAAAQDAQTAADNVATQMASAQVEIDQTKSAAAGATQLAQDAHDVAVTSDGRLTVASLDPTVADAAGRPEGALWQVRVDGVIARQYLLTNNEWEQTPVGAAMIGSKAISQAHIADAAIGTAHIADAAITDAKIGSLSASKITSGYLAAGRIAAGSITSDKLTIANGYITTAMIKDAAVTSAKIAALDAGKITTGTLSAARIGARSISADKLATNAIQVGLAGWTQSIRITPYQIAWYNGSTLEGTITSAGMQFWYGTRYIGEFARRAHKDKPNVQGIVNQLAYKGDYVAWTYQKADGGTYYTCLTLDPKGLFYGKAGIHLGSDLRTGGYKFYTTGSRYVTLQDCTLTGKGTYSGWVGQSGLSKIVFHTYDLMVVTNGSYYNMTRLFDRTKDLMSRMNAILSLLNQGWITSISGSGSNITWRYFSNTGLSAMSTNLA
ncbi:phage minor structural protein, N-terminal domain protein [Mobiluncus holmesii ATCC 35242]|uniref:Phage minor structural protein, N-terminal domain protein n=1 Tax=Mobiluncus holmesii ATCC 35242 TaxID=887899 RepID=E6M3C6_9ACTO|nr:phage tail spike protein [Mobiluncus holmesii]EFU82462.1 phage minor structural protein, N-terminal domain protein [Mobiluncus holmesii ATCC 35242]STY88532.1 Phage-related protein [Mobiluncus holmesii]